MSLQVTFLGTGTSHGIPVVACGCPVCLSTNPRNKRTRTSIAIRNGEQTLLIDTPPDLRTQALQTNLTRVDALAFTHAHADHIFGLDDLRRYNELQGNVIPCYGHRQTLDVIRRTFDYVFRTTQLGGGKPRLQLELISGPFEAAGMEVIPVPVWHGKVKVLGYRVGNFAYVTDVSRIPPESVELLRGLDTLVLGVLRYTPHPTHFNLEQGLAQVEALRPRRALFTHISHEFDHDTVNAAVPRGVELAYDGMVLELS